MPPKTLIVVVEDERDAAGMIAAALTGEGFEVAVAGSVFQGRGMVERRLPALVVLDRQLPDCDGVELCRWMRQTERVKDIPIIFLTGKKSTEDRVAGLTIGADDYLPKPFSPAELVARVRAILRRSQAGTSAAAVLEAGGIRLDLDSRKASVKGKEIKLAPKELDLLQAFMERKDRALSRSFLLSRVWGYGADVELSTKVVDVTVGNLRNKLGTAGKLIVSVTKFGYRFEPGA